jgi:hypothetical protein
MSNERDPHDESAPEPDRCQQLWLDERNQLIATTRKLIDLMSRSPYDFCDEDTYEALLEYIKYLDNCCYVEGKMDDE